MKMGEQDMTEKQREASRLNGSKSDGPVTAEGKRRSSLNARRHQLAAEDLVLNAEEMEDFDHMLSAYLAELQPRTEIEADLVEEMAAAKWRERRCWRLQKAKLEDNVSLMAKYLDRKLGDAERLSRALTKDGETRGFQLLQRYESMHTRTWRRSWRDLLEIRKLQNEPGKGLNPVDSMAQTPQETAPATDPLPDTPVDYSDIKA
jgi:hypothetical protein